MTDPISDMLIRIKNAQMAKKKAVVFGYSKIKLEIAKVLEGAGYLSGVAKKGKKNKKLIEVSLLYAEDSSPKISGLRRVSKPSKRQYRAFRDIKPVRHGFGAAIYSTPLGVMTGKEAQAKKVGGELLFEIY